MEARPHHGGAPAASPPHPHHASSSAHHHRPPPAAAAAVAEPGSAGAHHPFHHAGVGGPAAPRNTGDLLLPVLVLAGVATLLASVLVVRHFLAPRERHLHVIIASSAALFVGFWSALLPSLDVYASASGRIGPASLRDVYLVLFATIVAMLSLVLPFSFFFAKGGSSNSNSSRSNSRRSNSSNSSNNTAGAGVLGQVCAALRRTAVFVAAMGLALLAGLAFRPGHETWSTQALTQNWMDRVFDTEHQGSEALLFLTGGLATAGFCGVVLYTAYGMAAMPLSFIRGYKDPELERIEVETELVRLRSRLRVLERKRSAPSDKSRATKLKLQGRVATKRQHMRALDNLADRDSRACCCFRVAGPCRVLVGVLLLAATCMLTTAIVLSASDPGLESAAGCVDTRDSGGGGGDGGSDGPGNGGGGSSNAAVAAGTGTAGVSSPPTSLLGNVTSVADVGAQVIRLVCQAETGYLGTLLNKPRLFNPFDETLVYLADTFPLDLVVMSGALAFMFAASLYGVSRLGLRCCVCLAVYRFRRKATSASAMLVFGAVSMTVGLALLVQVPALAPKYATFGPQTSHGSKVHCSLADEMPGAVSRVDRVSGEGGGGHGGGGAAGKSGPHCVMSEVAVLLVQMTRGYPVFSHIFYLASWLYASVVVLSLLLRGCCGARAPNFTDFDFDGEDASGSDGGDDVEMSRGLLSSSSSAGGASRRRRADDPRDRSLSGKSVVGDRLVDKYAPEPGEWQNEVVGRSW